MLTLNRTLFCIFVLQGLLSCLKIWKHLGRSGGEKEDAMMKYLSCYVFQITITRLISMNETHVTFCYKDHRAMCNQEAL